MPLTGCHRKQKLQNGESWRYKGLTRAELRHIFDPKDVYGPDFPGETFRVLKDKEEKRYGEYRTRRLVLEAWDKQNDK